MIKKLIYGVFALLISIIILLLIFAWVYGLRYPTFLLDPKGVEYSYSDEYLHIKSEGAYFQKVSEDKVYFRAYAPNIHFEIQVDSLSDTQFSKQKQLVLSNVHQDAKIENLVEVSKNRLQRTFDLSHLDNQIVEANVFFPKQENYSFAATGDTGGAHELYWTMVRSKQLGADFLIHVGDLKYQDGDLESLPKVYAMSPIPVYTSLGNHEFHEDGELLYQVFLDEVGPRNTEFTLGEKRFINIDTAVDTFFPSRGLRGKLIRSIEPLEEMKEKGINEYLLFTHNPLTEPLFLTNPSLKGQVKEFGHFGEGDWLRSQFERLGVKTMIAGDVHVAYEFQDKEVYTYLVGEGMGHQDVFARHPISRILTGTVRKGELIKYDWHQLNMPTDAHCTRRLVGYSTKQSSPEIYEYVNQLMLACTETTLEEFMLKYDGNW